MTDKQNQDIKQTVMNMENQTKEAEEKQQEKILSMIGDHLERQMETLTQTMLNHMDKKFKMLEEPT